MSDANDPGSCVVCGRQGTLHLTEIYGDQKTSASYCVEHVPEPFRSKLPADFGTPAGDVATLRRLLAVLDEQVEDPVGRAEMRAELEKQIEEIEAGRARLGGEPHPAVQ